MGVMLKGKFMSNNQEGLVVVFMSDGQKQIPIASISQKTFVELIQINSSSALVRHSVKDRFTGVPSVKDTHFKIDGNEHVMTSLKKWQY